MKFISTMNSRERFLRCNKFQSVDHAPFLEIGVWGQTTERWYKEGMPKDVNTSFLILSGGNEYFGLERWEAIPLNVGMVPVFEHEVLEEDERIILKLTVFS